MIITKNSASSYKKKLIKIFGAILRPTIFRNKHVLNDCTIHFFKAVINQLKQQKQTSWKNLEGHWRERGTFRFMSNINKMSKNNCRQRFSDEQIKSLEITFETESRPELRMKQHLANKLGLQPRQIAIWFQNKRARSKSKELERKYDVLKADYDKLASQFESLKEENQALCIQVLSHAMFGKVITQ